MHRCISRIPTGADRSMHYPHDASLQLGIFSECFAFFLFPFVFDWSNCSDTVKNSNQKAKKSNRCASDCDLSDCWEWQPLAVRGDANPRCGERSDSTGHREINSDTSSAHEGMHSAPAWCAPARWSLGRWLRVPSRPLRPTGDTSAYTCRYAPSVCLAVTSRALLTIVLVKSFLFDLACDTNYHDMSLQDILLLPRSGRRS